MAGWPREKREAWLALNAVTTYWEPLAPTQSDEAPETPSRSTSKRRMHAVGSLPVAQRRTKRHRERVPWVDPRLDDPQ